MSFINYSLREITLKVVYYGPGQSGKTTNLIQIFKKINSLYRGEMISLDTEGERTLFFDFFPLDLGKIAGFKLKLQLFTVPGQMFYAASRKLVLAGADGIVFVADSQLKRFDENIRIYEEMQETLKTTFTNPERIPIVMQYNKRDLEELIPVGSIESALDLGILPRFKSIATQCKGVMKTVRYISKAVINKFQFV